MIGWTSPFQNIRHWTFPFELRSRIDRTGQLGLTMSLTVMYRSES